LISPGKTDVNCENKRQIKTYIYQMEYIGEALSDLWLHSFSWRNITTAAVQG